MNHPVEALLSCPSAIVVPAGADMRREEMLQRGSLGQVTLQFPSLRIDAVNRAFCTMTGYGNKDLVGHEVTCIFRETC